MFTKEIEEALVEKRIDLAVHSLKDLPTELAPEFVLAAIPERADPRDAFVSIEFDSFFELPSGAKVGSSSPRRQTQLRNLRADLEYIEFRGNVDTRLRKLEEGQAQAIILAASGLDRLGRTEWIRQRFDVEHLCPAAGQGALAIECRVGDSKLMGPSPFSITPTPASPSLRNALLSTRSAEDVRFPLGCIVGARVGGSVSAEWSQVSRARHMLPRARPARTPKSLAEG